MSTRRTALTDLIAKQLCLLHHHPHLRREIRDAVDFERTFVPLGQEAVGFFEFAPEEERAGGDVAGEDWGRHCRKVSLVDVYLEQLKVVNS